MKLRMAVLVLAFPFLSACIERDDDSKQEAENQANVDPYINGIGDLEPGEYTVHLVSSGASSSEEGYQVGWVSITKSGRIVRNSVNYPSPQWVGNTKFTNDQDFEWHETFVDWKNGISIHEPTETQGTVLDEKTFSTPSPSGGPETQLLYVKVDQDTQTPPITLEELSATYTGYNFMVDNRTISFTIDSGGAITGADNKGCVFNGQVSNLSPNYRIFDIDFEAENCQGDTISASKRNGSFSGVGILDQIASVDIFDFYGAPGTFGTGSTGSTGGIISETNALSFFAHDDDFAYHFLRSESLLQMQRLRELYGPTHDK